MKYEKLSKYMKTFFDAIDEAAKADNWPDGNTFLKTQYLDALDIFFKAAEIYLQSAQLQAGQNVSAWCSCEMPIKCGKMIDFERGGSTEINK